MACCLRRIFALGASLGGMGVRTPFVKGLESALRPAPALLAVGRWPLSGREPTLYKWKTPIGGNAMGVNGYLLILIHIEIIGIEFQ